MATTKNLLETYAAADEEQRLSLFLSHRDLRQQFTRIDMAAVNNVRKAPSKQKQVLMGRRRSISMAVCCWGWLTHRCSTK